MFSNSMKKTVITTLSTVVLGGFFSTAAMVQFASADNELEKQQALASEVDAEINGRTMTDEQRAKLKSQLLAQGKTDAEAEVLIEEMLKRTATTK